MPENAGTGEKELTAGEATGRTYVAIMTELYQKKGRVSTLNPLKFKASVLRKTKGPE